MARFEIIEGPPGQGKSLYTARIARKLLQRNKKWYDKQLRDYQIALASYTRYVQMGVIAVEPVVPQKRRIASNMRFSESFERVWGDWIVYWSDTQELTKMTHVDVLWDEIATELDSRNWVNLSVELKRFLSQYRKRGIDIYANTQDFSMVDVRARLMITSVSTLTKLVGSQDISVTKPKPKHIWGLIMVREVLNYKEVEVEKKQYNLIPTFFFITKDLISIYDTTQDIPLGQMPPLKHVVRRCEHFGEPGHKCENHEKIVHL